MMKISQLFFLLEIAIVIREVSLFKSPANGDCESGSFPCNTTGVCIPQLFWCDEQVHCDDGSDEASCIDEAGNDVINRKHRKRPGAEMDELPQECHFQRRSNEAKALGKPNSRVSIATNQIPINSQRDLHSMSSQSPEIMKSCQCKQRNIFCRHLRLSSAPEISLMFDFYHENNSGNVIDLLDLAGNSFPYVEQSTFQTLNDSQIRCLVLQHCSIFQMYGNCFIDILTNGLEELHLDGNILEHVANDNFNVTNNTLQLLSLGHNRISSIDAEAFHRLEGLIELDLRNNRIEKLNNEWFLNLNNLRTLNLQGNFLTYLDSSSWPAVTRVLMESTQDTHNDRKIQLEKGNQSQYEIFDETRGKGLGKLETLSLANNRIVRIEDEMFEMTTMAIALINLDLAENRIQYISNGTLKGLASLQMLSLSQNMLKKIHPDAFLWTPNLTSLDLKGNEYNRVTPRVFHSLEQLHHLYFDSFEMCANAPHVKVCEPKGDGISSKEHLLDSIVLRASVWIMALIGFVGNSIVLLGRQFVTKHTNVVDSLHIKNLAISDLLMSIYLFAIACVDEYYRGEYLLNEFNWRHSTWCTLSGFLNTLSCESSVLILSLVTWDRFVSVTRPFPRNQLSFKFAALRLITLWLIAMVVAFFPILHSARGFFGLEFYNSNGVCLPLYLHNPYAKGWQYSIAMFVFVNLSALAFISYAYLRMIRAIRVSTVACRSTQQTQERDRVAQHLGIIVFTDCLCWVPVIIIKMATLAGLELNRSHRNFVYASLAIYIMPLNSALNPILYTFATPLFKKQVTKLVHMCCNLRHKRTEGHSGYESALSLSLGMFGSNGRRILTYRGTQTSHTGSKNSWRKQPQAV